MAGRTIGGILGTIGGSIIGGFIGGLAYDITKNVINKGAEYLAGIKGQFQSGGVEFIYPKEIDKFKKRFAFEKIHFFAFEYEDEKNNFNVEKEIIDLINNKFLIGNIKVQNLDEVYDTILKEISYGFLHKKKLPSISLNFNKDKLLYSIMDDYYKSTITGNVLTFIDYYLKSYVNNGFFKEEFVFNWQNQRNEDLDYLEKNLFDYNQYLYDLTHNPNDINYSSMYDLTQSSENDANYSSAFRIIGYLENNLKYYKNIIFPYCSYFTQYDFDILPNWETKIDLDAEEKNKAESIRKYHKIMALRVTSLMKELPFLKPYFELLKMITFAIHYLPNIQRIGLFPLFNNALQNKYIGEKYCKSIPKVFPPLPIRKTECLKMKFDLKELFDIFKNNNYEELNKFISICYYEAEPKKLKEALNKQKFLLDKLNQYIKNKVKNNLYDKDKHRINLFSDEKLRIPPIKEKFIEYLFSFPKNYIENDYNDIYIILDQQENKLYKPKNSIDYISKVKSFSDLRKEIEEILNIYSIYLTEFFENEEKKLNEEIEKLNKEDKKEEKKEENYNNLNLNGKNKKVIKNKVNKNKQKQNVNRKIG